MDGQLSVDPLEMVQRMEGRAIEVLDAVTATSREWQLVAKNVNGLMETNAETSIKSSNALPNLCTSSL